MFMFLNFICFKTFPGTIKTEKILDRETFTTMNVTVYANDGKHNGPCLVIVTLLDINDNSPIFNSHNTTSYHMTEGNYTSPNYVQLVDITAEDADIGSNGNVTYSIVNDYDGLFYIDETKVRVYFHFCSI